MLYPHGLTEKEVMDAMNKAIVLLAQTFAFGYFDSDDIRQEAYIFGLEALSRYDPSRPLENFLYSHIKNRLINFKRDKYHRTDPPCKICAEHGKHPDGSICAKYTAWKRRNSSKQNLMRPLDIQNLSDENEKSIRKVVNIIDDATFSEIRNLIDTHLSIELRSIYLRIKSGEYVSKAKRTKLENALRELIYGRKKTK
jgi:DNA-directed RNA polymerase specialized sigma24 family protein